MRQCVSRRMMAKGVTDGSVDPAGSSARSSMRRVASALSHADALGASWCDRVSRSAAIRSTPVSGIRTAPSDVGAVSEPAPAASREATCSRSALVTMPPGPLPAIVLRSMPSSAARRRTSGDAGGDADACPAAPAVDGAGVTTPPRSRRRLTRPVPDQHVARRTLGGRSRDLDADQRLCPTAML